MKLRRLHGRFEAAFELCGSQVASHHRRGTWSGVQGDPLSRASRRIFVAGTSVRLKDLSAAQHNGQVGKILPQRAAATQERIPVALINGKNLSVTASNLKVEDDAMLNDSMPLFPPSQPADDALSGESWPPLDCVGIKRVGAIEDEDAVPENSMPPLDGRWQHDTCDQQRRNIQAWWTRLHFQ